MNAPTLRTLAVSAAFAAAGAAVPAPADEYQFIISGDTASAATAGVVAAESATGPLDVRHRAVAESRPMALSSIKNGGFVMVIR